jgi:beta-galactosidase GanA
VHLWQYQAEFFLEFEMFQTKVVEKIKTHILCSITFFSEDRTIYEVMWKNMLQPFCPQIKIQRMRFVCWITKTMDTISEYVALMVFPWRQSFCKHATILLYTYVAFIAAEYEVFTR